VPISQAEIEALAAGGAEAFVETGVWSGDTAAAAAGCFARVVTIDRDRKVVDRARARFAAVPAVEVRLGDSPAVIPAVFEDRPTAYYLDAHWFPGVAPGGSQCPLLAELAAIAGLAFTRRPVIVVDDVPVFRSAFWADGGAERAGFVRAQWPTLAAVTQAAKIACGGSGATAVERASGTITFYPEGVPVA
jgi:hypothetical protein